MIGIGFIFLFWALKLLCLKKPISEANIENYSEFLSLRFSFLFGGG